MSQPRSSFVVAVLKNALLWGVATGILAGGLALVGSFIFPGPDVHSLLDRLRDSLMAGVSLGVRFAIAGAAIGTFFAFGLRYAFRGGRIATLSIPRSALLGAIVGGVGIPLFYQFLNLVTGGHMIAWNLVTDDALWAAPFGAIAATTTIWVARRATALPREREQEALERGEVRRSWRQAATRRARSSSGEAGQGGPERREGRAPTRPLCW